MEDVKCLDKKKSGKTKSLGILRRVIKWSFVSKNDSINKTIKKQNFHRKHNFKTDPISTII